MIENEIEAEVGKSLPESYKKLLEGINDYSYINYNEFKTEFPDDDGVSWFFWGKERLGEISEVDGATENRKAWEVLKSYAEIKRPTNAHINDIFYKHINFLIAIAEDNGDILYMDANDNFSVWIYMHDSGQSKQLEENFDIWLKNSSIG